MRKKQLARHSSKEMVIGIEMAVNLLVIVTSVTRDIRPERRG